MEGAQHGDTCIGDVRIVEAQFLRGPGDPQAAPLLYRSPGHSPVSELAAPDLSQRSHAFVREPGAYISSRSRLGKFTSSASPLSVNRQSVKFISRKALQSGQTLAMPVSLTSTPRKSSEIRWASLSEGLQALIRNIGTAQGAAVRGQSSCRYEPWLRRSRTWKSGPVLLSSVQPSSRANPAPLTLTPASPSRRILRSGARLSSPRSDHRRKAQIEIAKASSILPAIAAPGPSRPWLQGSASPDPSSPRDSSTARR